MAAVKESSQRNAALYEADFVEWAAETALLLQQRRFDEINIASLVEEVEDLGKSQKNEISSRLSVVIMHLLKWRYQPDKRSRSWAATIAVQRLDMRKILKTSPSLMNFASRSFEEEYRDARRIALLETGLEKAAIPETPVFTLKQVLDEDYLP